MFYENRFSRVNVTFISSDVCAALDVLDLCYFVLA